MLVVLMTGLSREQMRNRERHEELADLLGLSVQELLGPSSRAGTKHKKRKDPKAYATYDWDAIARAYDETDQSKKAISDLAREFDCHPETVYRALDRTGRSYPEKTVGAPKQDVCKRGHDMEVHGRTMKRGGRYCSECKRMRERVSQDD